MTSKNRFPWCSLIITGFVSLPFFYKLFPVMSTGVQEFHDIIVENVAKSGLNKSGELSLFWSILGLGILLLCILFLAGNKLFHNKFCITIPQISSSFIRERVAACRFLLILLLPNLFHYVIFQKYNHVLILLSFIYLIACMLFPSHAKLVLCFYALTYYAVTGMITFLIQFIPGLPVHLSIYSFTFATFVTLTFILLRKIEYLKYAILWIQLPIIAVFSIYFVDDYLYQGNLITVRYATGYYIFFLALTAAFIIFGVYNIVRYHKTALQQDLSRLISATTVISIFIYNSFSACPMYAQPDQHHHGEQMIPWQQVFELGRSVYDEYTPVSGLFPMVIGAIQHLLLGGSASDYSPAVSIMMVIICILTMYLIYEHVGGGWALVFAIYFCLPCYNRQYLVLPLLLLLTLPKLTKKPLAWLLCWIMGCFLAGLYYPLFGAAILLGATPFGLVQIKALLKDPSVIKKPSYIIAIVIVFIPVICSIPLLFKILNHTLTYSSQTVLADGICLFGQSVPEFFMPYLSGHAFLRTSLYFGVRFFLPVIGVWLFVSFALMLFKKKNLCDKHFLFAIGGAITLCVSYTYTLVRADVNMILSRTSYILCAMAGIFLPILIITWYREHSLNSKSAPKSLPFTLLLLIACLVSLPMLLYRNIADVKTPAMWIYPNGESELFLDDTAKIYDHYEVPELLLKSEDTGLSQTNRTMLGKGFIVSDQLSYINHYQDVIEKCSAVMDDVTYMGLDGQGFYYFNNVKACATGFIPVAKGYEAQQEIIQRAKKERPVIFVMEPESTYYVYYWMHTNDYVYCDSDQCFYPSELFRLIYPDTEPDDYRDTATELSLDLIPHSFGRSIDSLKTLMTDKLMLTPSVDSTANTLSLYNGSAFSGKDYDMIYLELDTDKLIETANQAGVSAPWAITITFDDSKQSARENTAIHCSIADGKLLIPVGMQPGWLLTPDISSVSLSFDGQADASIYIDAIKTATFYKLRQ